MCGWAAAGGWWTGEGGITAAGMHALTDARVCAGWLVRASLLLSAGCASEAPEAPAPLPEAAAPDVPVAASHKADAPDIVVVVIDTLRADSLSLYGHDRPTSPTLDAIAADGLWFERAYAQSGWTLASFASLLTGLYPHQHLVSRDGCLPERFGRMAPATRTLAEALGEAGYATGAWMNNTFLAPEFGLQDGFDTYDYKGATNDQHRTAADTVTGGLDWLDKQEEGKPAFLMLHFMEPHLDYAPPADIHGTFATGPRPEKLKYPANPNPFTMVQSGQLELDEAERVYLKQLYDEEILAADRALGQLVDGLKARGRYDNTLLVVTSDHGEEFWEHGRFEHGHDLWSELTRIPLVLHGPGARGGKKVETIVEHVDLVAALVHVSGATIDGLPGADLFEVAKGPTAPRVALAENCLYGPSCVSLIDPTHRLMLRHVLQMPKDAPSREAALAGARAQKVINVWGLDAEGMERVELPQDEQQQRGRAMAKILQARRGTLEPLATTTGPALVGFETFSLLKELGYVERADEVAIPQTPCR